MGELAMLVNLGPETERQLIQAGIHTLEELRAAGAEEAWLRIQAFDPSACTNRLLGIEGAIVGVKKAHLPEERKAELKAFYQAHKLSKTK